MVVVGYFQLTQKPAVIAILGVFIGLLLGSPRLAAQTSTQPGDPYVSLRNFLNRDCPIGTTDSDAQQEIKTLLKTGDIWEQLVISILANRTDQQEHTVLLRSNERQQALEEWWARYQSFLKTRSFPSDQEDPLRALAKIDKDTFIREEDNLWRRLHQERAVILLAARAAQGSIKADAALSAANRTDDNDLQAIINAARRYFSAPLQ